ncbi:hypothetical protein EJB05_06345 [Eragrostis curvula]|uniref:Protein LNK1 n=1 Tax=Eragrostis curvula TaxID=38414 RepID=A0A5J9WHM5_9POAL|nr:hypothetical protein EJB05_06345 [Eragrostis curvula]
MPDWRVGELNPEFYGICLKSQSTVALDQWQITSLKVNSRMNLLGVITTNCESGIGDHGITSSKKLKHAVDSEKSTQGGISEANNSDSPKCNSEHIQSTNGVISQEINSITDCIGDCKDGSNAFPLREENAVVETRYGTDNWNTTQFALSNGSPILNNHNAQQGSLTYGDNDLNYIDWPGIDNFEDVDTLFRTCDSTYGQQQLENTNELSWIPSSDAIYSSDVALPQGFDPSYSDYGILDDLSAFTCPEDKSLSSVDPSAVLCDEQFSDNYPFSEQKNLNSYGEQASRTTLLFLILKSAYQEDAMELLPTDQICNSNGNFDMIGSQCSSENPIQVIEDQKFSIPSASQLSSSQTLLKQRHQLDSSSPSNVTSESYPDGNSQFSPSGASFAQRKVPKKFVNIHSRQSITDNAVNGHPQALTRRASYPCENYGTEKKGLGKRTLGDPQGTMVVDGSLVSSVSSDNSVEESSFRQLQDAVSQLDIQTKLCIRDGLYRLARSAQHRQVFPNAMNSSGDSQDIKDVQSAEASRKFVDPRSIETQTNPIDRSIALLLFHQSTDQVTGAVDDASSLKSHVSKKQHQDPAKNEGMPPAPSIYSPKGHGRSVDAKSRGNY